jgi:hypothetical protein
MGESSPLVRRYGQTAASEWQRVLNHFALGEGFALLILVVPDREARNSVAMKSRDARR